MSAAGPPPLFSVVTPVHDPPIEVLRATVDSVLAQSFPDWELVLVDDCSTDEAVRETLRAYAARDPRVRLVERAENGHIVAASNDGVAAARGTFVVLLDHDDLLTPDALAVNAREISRAPDVDYLYSDEDHVDAEGTLSNPFAKPQWSPERLRAQNYCCHLSVLRTELVREVGGFRAGFEGAQDHDLILRVTERARRVVHVPKVLYHWRIIEGSTATGSEAKPYAHEAGLRAVADHLDRIGAAAEVTLAAPGRYAVQRRLPATRRVAVVTPYSTDGVVETVRAALSRTAHEDLEVVVVCDEGTTQATRARLADVAGDRLVLARLGTPAGRSARTNLGVLAATGDRVVLLDETLSVRSEDWLTELVAPLEAAEVGLTGGKIGGADGQVLEAGLAFCFGQYLHPFRQLRDDEPGPFGALVVDREVSGVSTRLAALRRADFLAVGGLDEELTDEHAAVDLAQKVRRAGLSVLFLPRCAAVGPDRPAQTGADVEPSRDLLRRRWGRPGRDAYLPDFPGVPRPEERRRARAARLRTGGGAGGRAAG